MRALSVWILWRRAETWKLWGFNGSPSHFGLGFSMRYPTVQIFKMESLICLCLEDSRCLKFRLWKCAMLGAGLQDLLRATQYVRFIFDSRCVFCVSCGLRLNGRQVVESRFRILWEEANPWWSDVISDCCAEFYNCFKQCWCTRAIAGHQERTSTKYICIQLIMIVYIYIYIIIDQCWGLAQCVSLLDMAPAVQYPSPPLTYGGFMK